MPNKITIGVFAHANAGKTTVTEQLLKSAGVIDSVGRVDYGNTVTDNLKVEKERGITVRSSLVSFSAGKNNYDLIDTPGHIDFVAEVERSMNVLDCAIMVVSGVEGVEAQTYQIYKSLRDNNIPTIVFVNKMDRLGASLLGVKKDFDANLNGQFVYMNCVKDGKIVDFSNDEIAKQLAEFDEDSFNKYLDNKKIQSLKRLLELFKSGMVMPVLSGSALNGLGVDRLFDFLSQINISHEKQDELSALVYQVRVDNGTKNAYIKMFGGEISKRQCLTIGNENLKIKNLLMANGGKLMEVDTIKQGDVAIIQGSDLFCGQIIGECPPCSKLNFHKPLYSVKVVVKEGEIENAVKALKILTIEDPYLNFQYNEKTSQLKINIMGQVQAEIIKQFIAERFDVDVELKDFGVIYKETPMQESTGKASYTSCSEVEFRVTPLKRGEGVVFIDEVKQETIHPKYVKQIERLINYYKENSLHGWELTDCKISLISARSDSVISEPMHFNIAVPIALFRALKESGTILLEPYNKYDLITNEKDLKMVISMLSTQGATINNIEYGKESIVVHGGCSALASSKVLKTLPVITSGLGKIIFEFDSYKPTDVIKENQFTGYDPRNEIDFIQTQMGQTCKLLDKQPGRTHRVKYSQRTYDPLEL